MQQGHWGGPIEVPGSLLRGFWTLISTWGAPRGVWGAGAPPPSWSCWAFPGGRGGCRGRLQGAWPYSPGAPQFTASGPSRSQRGHLELTRKGRQRGERRGGRRRPGPMVGGAGLGHDCGWDRAAHRVSLLDQQSCQSAGLTRLRPRRHAGPPTLRRHAAPPPSDVTRPPPPSDIARAPPPPSTSRGPPFGHSGPGPRGEARRPRSQLSPEGRSSLHPAQHGPPWRACDPAARARNPGPGGTSGCGRRGAAETQSCHLTGLELCPTTCPHPRDPDVPLLASTPAPGREGLRCCFSPTSSPGVFPPSLSPRQVSGSRDQWLVPSQGGHSVQGRPPIPVSVPPSAVAPCPACLTAPDKGQGQSWRDPASVTPRASLPKARHPL